CNLGRSRFAHYCKKITNMSAADYLTHCRITKAQTVLQTHPHYSIFEVATACGFESSQYFATVFRKKVGLSPTDYKSQFCSKEA
ncbi:MAG: helix-turn-helix transcriptional regulator, partial [Anaerohalosphaeraceae bacterium]